MAPAGIMDVRISAIDGIYSSAGTPSSSARSVVPPFAPSCSSSREWIDRPAAERT
jgi:hypothetical protein